MLQLLNYLNLFSLGDWSKVLLFRESLLWWEPGKEPWSLMSFTPKRVLQITQFLGVCLHSLQDSLIFITLFLDFGLIPSMEQNSQTNNHIYSERQWEVKICTYSVCVCVNVKKHTSMDIHSSKEPSYFLGIFKWKNISAYK